MELIHCNKKKIVSDIFKLKSLVKWRRGTVQLEMFVNRVFSDIDFVNDVVTMFLQN